VSKYGTDCQVNGVTMDAKTILAHCTAASLQTYAACGSTQGERKQKRQQKRQMKVAYCQNVSTETGASVKPWMIGLLGGFILVFGGPLALLLCIAEIVFQKMIEAGYFATQMLEMACAGMGLV
jgi:hypothetical protein